jgi:hypothetical protein
MKQVTLALPFLWLTIRIEVPHGAAHCRRRPTPSLYDPRRTLRSHVLDARTLRDIGLEDGARD